MTAKKSLEFLLVGLNKELTEIITHPNNAKIPKLSIKNPVNGHLTNIKNIPNENAIEPRIFVGLVKNTIVL